MSLILELKRRNVFRIAAAYVVTAWLLIQVAETIFPLFGYGDTPARVAVIVLAIGFIPALIFSWVFELTPDGLKKEGEVARFGTDKPGSARKLDRAIIVVLALAVTYFLYDELVMDAKYEAAADLSSIAILPFDNRSSEAEDAFFSDGIHDDLLTSLSRIANLKVISRTSVMRYRDTEMSIPDIAKELGVGVILEGGIQRAGDTIRVNVQLIHAKTDDHIWAEKYDRELSTENLFAIQNDITSEITAALRVALSDTESEQLNTAPTDSLEAYGEYVLGRSEMANRTPETLKQALGHFQKAVELDPNYALAYVGIADSLHLSVVYAAASRNEILPVHKEAIDKALTLNPLLGEAWASKAMMKMRFANHNFDPNSTDTNVNSRSKYVQQQEESIPLFQKSIELAPNYAQAYHWIGILYRDLGRNTEAELNLRKAIEIDPLGPVLKIVLWGILLNEGRGEEATAVLIEGVRQNPTYRGFYPAMAGYLGSLSRLGEAAQWSNAGMRLGDIRTDQFKRHCWLLLKLDDFVAAERCYDDLEERFPGKIEYRMQLYSHQLWARQPNACRKMVALHNKMKAMNPPPQNTSYLSINLSLRCQDEFQGGSQVAMDIYKNNWPFFFGNDEISVTDFNLALGAIVVLAIDGRIDRVNYLLNQGLNTMKSMSIDAMGFNHPAFHVLLGDKDNALVAFREMIDSDYLLAFHHMQSQLFDSMLDEPEWNALIKRYETGVARQREWFEDHKDESPF